MKSLFLKIIRGTPMMMFGLFLGFVAIEGIVRFFYPQERQLFQADALIRTIHKPNVETVRNQSEFTSRIKTNAQGFVGQDFIKEKSSGVVRIATIGDSQTEGFQVDYDATSSAILEKSLNSDSDRRYQVYNFGISGTGTIHQELIYKHYAKSYDPDVVILEFYIGNDVSDDMLLRAAPDGGRVVQGGWFRVFLSNNFQAPRFIIRRLEQVRAIQDVLTNTGLIPRRADYYNEAGQYSYPYIYDIYNIRTDTVFTEAFKESCDTIRRFYSEVTSDGAKMLVVILPDKNSLFSEDWEKTLKSFPAMQDQRWDLGKPIQAIRSCLDESKIPHADMYEYFRALLANGAERMYYKEDVHLNQDGHRLLGEYLNQKVQELLR